MPLIFSEPVLDERPTKYGDTKCMFVRDKEDVPHEGGLPDLYALAVNEDGTHARTDSVLSGIKSNLPSGVELVGDPAAWDCALIVHPNTPASQMVEVYAALRGADLEPMSEDEHEPELLDDGRVRIWLVPTEPGDPFDEDASPAQDLEIAA
ncbi:hypothetical protein [Streptomyces sp. NPDC058701]|uniref:hypothetical protein n=1 Tax=Streptomyces sp. NPDC058701 TaxID=3346608 RepID=UPI003653205C